MNEESKELLKERWKNPLERLAIIFGMSKSEIFEALGILPIEFRREFEVEKRKVQLIGTTLLVSIPMEYAELMGIQKGQEVLILWRKDSKANNPLLIKV